MTKDPSSRRAAVILFGLCVIAASAIAGAAVYRYAFWGDQLPGGFSVAPVDLDGQGSPEYLVAKVLVDVPESGDYTAVGVLANPATGNSIATTTGRVEMDRGTDVFGLGFWGPDIRKAEVSGPYTVRLTLIREQSDGVFERPASPDMVGRVYQWSHTTPAYDWRTFQEQPSDLTITGAATASNVDYDGDGHADALSLSVPVSVRKAGVYFVRAESDALTLPGVTDRFFPNGGFESRGPQFIEAAPGVQTVEVSVSSDQMYLSGVDGPVAFRIRVTGGTQTVDTHPCCGTPNTSFSEAPAFNPPPDGSVFGLRAPYVLPPTPAGVLAETTVTQVVHWYDFRGPTMPIEFTGAVRDHGTDLDGNGLFDSLTVEADVLVRNSGSYDLSGTLYAAGSVPSDLVLTRGTPSSAGIVTTAWRRVSMGWTGSTNTVSLDFSGAELLRAGVPGPYDVKLRIVPANVIIDPVVAHVTAAYDLASFEATGPKEARLPAVSIENPSFGAYAVSLDASSLPGSYTLMVRIIHANGVVAAEGTVQGGSPRVSLATDGARAGDFAVAVYLMGPAGDGVDYIELPLAS